MITATDYFNNTRNSNYCNHTNHCNQCNIRYNLHSYNISNTSIPTATINLTSHSKHTLIMSVTVGKCIDCCSVPCLCSSVFECYI